MKIRIIFFIIVGATCAVYLTEVFSRYVPSQSLTFGMLVGALLGSMAVFAGQKD